MDYHAYIPENLTMTKEIQKDVELASYWTCLVELFDSIIVFLF